MLGWISPDKKAFSESGRMTPKGPNWLAIEFCRALNLVQRGIEIGDQIFHLLNAH